MKRWTMLFLGLLSGCGTPQPAEPATQPTTTAPATAAASPVATAATAASSEAAATALPTTPSATVAATASAPAPPPPNPADQLPSPLPKQTVVLHVGDSMADALGKDLKRELEKRGIKAPHYAKEATYIPQWAGYKMKLSQYIAQHDPDLVIVTLGGNEVRMPDPSIRADPVRRLVKKIGDRPCLWIAAPLWPGAPHTGILDVVRENCAPCIYVDTNKIMSKMEVLGDKVHPTLKERKRWAKFMVRWLMHNRDPEGKRAWDFKLPTSAPPEGSEKWLDLL